VFAVELKLTGTGSGLGVSQVCCVCMFLCNTGLPCVYAFVLFVSLLFVVIFAFQYMLGHASVVLPCFV
jgi:hypothetical protein